METENNSSATLNSIPKIYTLGTKYNTTIFDGLVVIQEKVDGSQFSFGVKQGKLLCRSKGQMIDLENPGMFKLAVETAKRLRGQLVEGWVYQAEFLGKPKHNVLVYSQVPEGNLALFDVRTVTEYVSNPGAVASIAKVLGIGCVRRFYEGYLTPGPAAVNAIDEYLLQDSMLGGTKVEGVVVKNYAQQHPEREGHPMTAKFVSNSFKERMDITAVRNPKALNDDIQRIINCLRTEARYAKAVQHLREKGLLKNDNSDIGKLIGELRSDFETEESDWVKNALFEAFQKEIFGGMVRGFAQWYQNTLAGGLTVWQQFLVDKNEDPEPIAGDAQDDPYDTHITD